MLSLERLRVLQAVARHGSVTAAAAELRVTTSAVSQQLTKLERESGTTLVERSGRGIRLTDAACCSRGTPARSCRWPSRPRPTWTRGRERWPGG